MATETQAIRENYELGVLAGEAREQQRIIKLLEPYVKYADEFADAIALIKGEN